MIGYGLAKAAVHQLTKSLADKNGGLPANAAVQTILPVTLDTPMNRKFMSDAGTLYGPRIKARQRSLARQIKSTSPDSAATN